MRQFQRGGIAVELCIVPAADAGIRFQNGNTERFILYYAVIRGFFWGTKSFYAYSLIELAEEAVMVIVGTVCVLKASTVTEKTVMASIAVLVSYVFSFVVSSIVFFKASSTSSILLGSFILKYTGNPCSI